MNTKMIYDEQDGSMDYYIGEQYPFEGGMAQVVWNLSVSFDKYEKMNVVRMARCIEVKKESGNFRQKIRQHTIFGPECNRLYCLVELAKRNNPKRLKTLLEEIATPDFFKVIEGVEENRTSPMGDNCVVYLNQHCKDLSKRVDAKLEAQKIEKAMAKKKAQPTNCAPKDAKRL